MSSRVVHPLIRPSARMPTLLGIALGLGCALTGCGDNAPAVMPAPAPVPAPTAPVAPAAPAAPAAPTTPVAPAAPVSLTVPVIPLKARDWEAVGWGGGGHFIACAFHPTRDGVVYLGGDVNGFFKSEDYGKHFRILNDGLSNYGGFAIAPDPKHPDTVFLGTPGGVNRSRDAGENWTFLPETGRDKLGITFTDRGKHPLVVDPRTGALLAGTAKGVILRSTDSGDTWQKVHTLTAAGAIVALTTAAQGGRLIAATSTAALLTSSDDGVTWTAMIAPAGVQQVAMAATDAKIFYAACGAKAIAKSSDAGATWTELRNGLGEKDSVTEVVVDPTDAAVACAITRDGYGGGIARTGDGGATWTKTTKVERDLVGDPTLPEEGAIVPFAAPTNIVCDPRHPQQLFLAADWRSAGSSDGGRTWVERDGGADMACVHDIRFLDGKTYVTAMDEGLMMSDNQGKTWDQLAPRRWSKEMSGHQWRVLPQKLPDGRVRIVTLNSPWDAPGNRVLLSEDGGKSFAIISDGLPEKRPTVNAMWGQGYARALTGDPKDPSILYLGIDGDPDTATNSPGGGIFKSTDGGHHWKQMANQPGSRRMYYGLVVDPTDSKRLFWGACKDGGGLYRSEDGGDSWQLVFSKETWIFNVAVAADGTVYCPGNQLWRSTDHGTTWTTISDFKEGGAIVGLELHPTDPLTMWTSRVSWGDSSTGHINKTTDGGATWQDITGDIPVRNAAILRYDPASSYLWAGAVGLYRLKQ